MLHREEQIVIRPEKYDIVRAKKSIRVLPGRMNSFNKQVEHKEFNGYALVIGTSDSFAQVYFPNRTRKLLRVANLIVVSKLKIDKNL
jgi:ABC-type Fe3+/spermidine/putrescine transport system ATPase subunit